MGYNSNNGETNTKDGGTKPDTKPDDGESNTAVQWYSEENSMEKQPGTDA